MENARNKVELIRKISSYHPGYEAGRKREWSYYVGGMRDSGGWYFWKMYDEATEQELLDCLAELEEASKPLPPLSPEQQVKQNTIVLTPNGISNLLEEEGRAELLDKQMKYLMWGK